MWSKKGICELELHTPVPSRLMLTSTLVSLVSLFTVAALTAKGQILRTEYCSRNQTAQQCLGYVCLLF